MLSANDYKVLVEQAPIMIWRARTDTLCDYFNERWLAFRGRSMEQEFGNGWVDGVHPDELAECVRIYLTAFHRREVFEMHYRLQRHDGLYRWIFDRGVPLFEEDGTFMGYVGSCIDVTERIEAQNELKQRQADELQCVSKLLPICSWCKKIRTDDGYWREVDEYFTTQHQQLTHCMCVDCGKTMLRDLADQIAKENPDSGSQL